MAAAALNSLRERLNPPRAARRAGVPADGEGPDVARVLALAAGLFEVEGAALVVATAEGLAVRGAGGEAAEAARALACRLFEALAAAEPGGGAAGVLEEVTPGAGFAAAAPVLSPAGRCLGAICLLDAGRRTLLSGLQRRLLAEIGDLVAPRLGGAAPARAGSLRRAAEAAPEAFALFDEHGRCLLRNARFDALLGGGAPASPEGDDPREAAGRENDWLAERIMRDRPPVGVYRAARPDGTWLSVEERRGPRGRSLILRQEDGGAFGDADAQLLFERCPFPMFVFDQGTRAIVAVNAAALSLYGWDRDAFLRLDLDGIGPMPPTPEGGARAGTHRARDGRALPVSARAVALAHRGRPAVLVTVVSEVPPADRAA